VVRRPVKDCVRHGEDEFMLTEDLEMSKLRRCVVVVPSQIRSLTDGLVQLIDFLVAQALVDVPRLRNGREFAPLDKFGSETSKLTTLMMSCSDEHPRRRRGDWIRTSDLLNPIACFTQRPP
jgi:hypothetical protein